MSQRLIKKLPYCEVMQWVDRAEKLRAKGFTKEEWCKLGDELKEQYGITTNRIVVNWLQGNIDAAIAQQEDELCAVESSQEDNTDDGSPSGKLIVKALRCHYEYHTSMRCSGDDDCDKCEYNLTNAEYGEWSLVPNLYNEAADCIEQLIKKAGS